MMNRYRAVLLRAVALAAALAAGSARAQNPPPTMTAPPAEGTYDLSSVEEMPELANRADVARLIQRSYPPEMRSRGETGTVTLRFRIQEDGRVDSASVMIENATSPEFTEPAAKVARAMRFRPAKIENRAVPVWVTVPIPFRLEPRSAPATRAPGDARPPRSRE
ncbi:MAG TPA: energy transducer TonB [Longimicrobium sp.]|jgi:protein TonB